MKNRYYLLLIAALFSSAILTLASIDGCWIFGEKVHCDVPGLVPKYGRECPAGPTVVGLDVRVEGVCVLPLTERALGAIGGSLLLLAMGLQLIYVMRPRRA